MRRGLIWEGRCQPLSGLSTFLRHGGTARPAVLSSVSVARIGQAAVSGHATCTALFSRFFLDAFACCTGYESMIRVVRWSRCPHRSALATKTSPSSKLPSFCQCEISLPLKTFSDLQFDLVSGAKGCRSACPSASCGSRS